MHTAEHSHNQEIKLNYVSDGEKEFSTFCYGCCTKTQPTHRNFRTIVAKRLWLCHLKVIINSEMN